MSAALHRIVRPFGSSSPLTSPALSTAFHCRLWRTAGSGCTKKKATNANQKEGPTCVHGRRPGAPRPVPQLAWRCTSAHRCDRMRPDSGREQPDLSAPFGPGLLLHSMVDIQARVPLDTSEPPPPPFVRTAFWALSDAQNYRWCLQLRLACTGFVLGASVPTNTSRPGTTHPHPRPASLLW